MAAKPEAKTPLPQRGAIVFEGTTFPALIHSYQKLKAYLLGFGL